jgi:hypothetical protein
LCEHRFQWVGLEFWLGLKLQHVPAPSSWTVRRWRYFIRSLSPLKPASSSSLIYSEFKVKRRCGATGVPLYLVCLFQRSNKHPALAPAYRFANGCDALSRSFSTSRSESLLLSRFLISPHCFSAAYSTLCRFHCRCEDTIILVVSPRCSLCSQILEYSWLHFLLPNSS